jgi:hypothetical protein
MSLTNLKSPFSTSQWDSIKNYISNQITARFNPSNTESGTSSVEINATSGVAVFDDLIEPNRSVIFTINNTSAKEDSILWVSLRYNNGTGDGKPLITNYWTSAQSIQVEVYNVDTNNTANNMSIAFQIVG